MFVGLPLMGGACAEKTRCRYNVDCPEGQVCSNEQDPQGAGVCVLPCDRHIAVPECVDAAPEAPVDAGQDASTDAGTDAGTDAEVGR